MGLYLPSVTYDVVDGLDSLRRAHGRCVFCAIGLSRKWGTEQHRLTKSSAVFSAIVATSLACIATAYVQFVRPLPAFDYRVEASGILISLLGTAVGLAALRFPRWYSLLALAISVWMLAWFAILGSTYETLTARRSSIPGSPPSPR